MHVLNGARGSAVPQGVTGNALWGRFTDVNTLTLQQFPDIESGAYCRDLAYITGRLSSR